jgi:hypothetical protein
MKNFYDSNINLGGNSLTNILMKRNSTAACN